MATPRFWYTIAAVVTATAALFLLIAAATGPYPLRAVVLPGFVLAIGTYLLCRTWPRNREP